eukprot:CFRG0869T1
MDWRFYESQFVHKQRDILCAGRALLGDIVVYEEGSIAISALEYTFAAYLACAGSKSHTRSHEDGQKISRETKTDVNIVLRDSGQISTKLIIECFLTRSTLRS